jgi:hypothetical protein
MGDVEQGPLNDTIVRRDWRVFRSENQLIPIGFVVFEESAITTARTTGGGMLRMHRPLSGLLPPSAPPSRSTEEQYMQTAIRQSVESLASDAERIKRAAEVEARELKEAIKLSMTSSALSSSCALDEDLDLVFALQQRYAFKIQFSFFVCISNTIYI